MTLRSYNPSSLNDARMLLLSPCANQSWLRDHSADSMVKGSSSSADLMKLQAVFHTPANSTASTRIPFMWTMLTVGSSVVVTLTEKYIYYIVFIVYAIQMGLLPNNLRQKLNRVEMPVFFANVRHHIIS